MLLAVRDLPFGSDVHRVDGIGQMRAELLKRLAAGPRVLKQQRGHSGIYVWRVEQRAAGRFALRHAQRDASEEVVDFDAVVRTRRLAPYFDNGASMVDQARQPRLVEGITRAYLVRDRVMGFGPQALQRCG